MAVNGGHMKVVEIKHISQRPPAPIWPKKNKKENGFNEILENAIKAVKCK